MPEIRTGRRLVFKDGSTIEDGEAGLASGFLWCYVQPMTMQEAVNIFTSTAKTDRITFEYGEMEDVYEGYTNCIIINANGTEQTQVCLTRPAE